MLTPFLFIGLYFKVQRNYNCFVMTDDGVEHRKFNLPHAHRCILQRGLIHINRRLLIASNFKGFILHTLLVQNQLVDFANKSVHTQ